MPGSGVNINVLPKVSLHDHLDGGLRPATIIELAEAIGLDLPATTEPDLADWFVGQATSGSLEDYLKTFDVTVAVMQTHDALVRVAREFVEDLALDGVIYAEVRWAPEQHTEAGLSLDQAVDAVQEGIEAGIDRVAQAGISIKVGQLITAMCGTVTSAWSASTSPAPKRVFPLASTGWPSTTWPSTSSR
jgi:adenosine deaminase